MRVDVYRNLNATDEGEAWSIKSMDKHYRYGEVISHARTVFMRDAKPVIQESELERYKETGQKNVHAMLRGKAMAKNKEVVELDREIYYDEEGEFRYKDDNSKFESAEAVCFHPDGSVTVRDEDVSDADSIWPF